LRRKKMVIVILSVVALTVVSGSLVLKLSYVGGSAAVNSDAIQDLPQASDDNNSDENDFTYIPPVLENSDDITPGADAKPNPEATEEPFVPATEMDLEPTSLTAFVNKEYALPKTYVPSDLVQAKVIFNLITYDERTYMRKEAAGALEKLFAAAKTDGYILYGVSGYRSYERQHNIFLNNIIHKGKDYTLRYSAAPGTSEHQTGLVMDVSAESLGFKLSDEFASSKEGVWLAENAHYYGYIIRYPKGKATITGYSYEPWHIRYVGKALAEYLYAKGLTLEEYYQYTPSPDFDFESKYANLINYIPPNITIIPEEEEVVLDENGEIITDKPSDGKTPVDEKEDGKTTDNSKDAVTVTPKSTPTPKPEATVVPDETTDEDQTGDTEDTGTDSETTHSDITPVPTPVPTPIPSPTPTLKPQFSTDDTSDGTNGVASADSSYSGM